MITAVLPVSLVYAAPEVLNVGTGSVDLQPSHMRWSIADGPADYSADQVFNDYAGESLNRHTGWFVFTVAGTAEPGAARYLQLESPKVERLEVWVKLSESWQQIMWHGVDGQLSINHNTRPGVLLPINDSPYEVAIETYDRTQFRPDLRLLTETDLYSYTHRVLFSEILGFGVLLALTLYAFILLWVVRERAYLWMGLTVSPALFSWGILLDMAHFFLGLNTSN